jgi:hypothetical protein
VPGSAISVRATIPPNSAVFRVPPTLTRPAQVGAPFVRRVRAFCAILFALRARCLRQQEGVDLPRKYLPRKTIPADIRSLARGHTELCIKVLAGIVSQEAVPPAARVSAAGILLDRGWGRAPQPHAGEDGKDIRITIRKMMSD